MGRYVKKPIEIDAMQLPAEGEEADENLIDFLHSMDYIDRTWESDRDGGLVIHTLEGDMLASPGDWIIKGVKGEFYPCKPDIFELTYDEVPA